jgi:hypothetical protein
MLVTANATLGAETTKVIGTVRNLGNGGGVLDAVVGATYPANALAVGVLNGSNIGRLVGDETSGLWVNIKAGAGSGGTAIADKGAWTVSSTNFTLTGGEFTTGGATACTTGQACTAAMTAGRGFFTDMNTWSETSLGVPTAYGVAPTTGNYIGVNAFVTNATAAIGNNADGVAVTTGGNSPTISYLEGFNGTTWDRLQVDASKSLKVYSNTAQVNGVTVLTGTGATGTGAQRVTVSTDQATNAGAALVKGGVGVVNGGSFRQEVDASATATVLQQSTGAAGDYLSHCVIFPATTTPGVVQVFDNTNASGNYAINFPGGASSVSNLAPIPIPIGAVSVAGAWKVTTTTNVSVVCYGRFS